MKYSKSAIGLLTREYRSVLKKCLLINLGLFALGAIATPANATVTEAINIQNNTDRNITEDVDITNMSGHGILVSTPDVSPAVDEGSILTINADSVKVEADRAAIWSQHRTENGPNNDPTKISIIANTINLKGYNGGGGGNTRSSDGYGVVTAMSQGIVELKGNTTITANPLLNNDAILARGNAVVKINENATTEKTVINGNIDFNYNNTDSGSTINAVVDVTLRGEDSVWNGNTVMSYDSIAKPEKMYQDQTTIRLEDGATWNASAISDVKEATDGGYYYTTLNNLNANKANVNIADTTRGISVQNLKVGANGITVDGGTMHVTTSVDTRNGVIDTGLDNIEVSENGAKLYVDADLSASTKDEITIATGKSAVIDAITVLGGGASTNKKQSINFGDNVSFSDAAVNAIRTATGHDVTVSDGEITFTQADEAADAFKLGDWTNGNYIQAYNDATSATTSLGANVQKLDSIIGAGFSADSTIADQLGAKADLTNTNQTITAGTYNVANKWTMYDAEDSLIQKSIDGKSKSMLSKNGGLDLIYDDKVYFSAKNGSILGKKDNNTYFSASENELILSKSNGETMKEYFKAGDGSLKLSKAGSEYLNATDTGLRLSNADGKTYFSLVNTDNVKGLNLNKADGSKTMFSVNSETGNVISEGKIEAKGNVQAAGLTFDNASIANGFAKVDGETTEIKLASQGYVDNGLATKYNFSAIVGTPASGDDPEDPEYVAAEAITANTPVYSKNATDAAISGAVANITEGVTNMYNKGHNWAEYVLGVDVDADRETQLQTALNKLGAEEGGDGKGNNIAADNIAGALHELDVEKLAKSSATEGGATLELENADAFFTATGKSTGSYNQLTVNSNQEGIVLTATNNTAGTGTTSTLDVTANGVFYYNGTEPSELNEVATLGDIDDSILKVDPSKYMYNEVKKAENANKSVSAGALTKLVGEVGFNMKQDQLGWDINVNTSDENSFSEKLNSAMYNGLTKKTTERTVVSALNTVGDAFEDKKNGETVIGKKTVVESIQDALSNPKQDITADDITANTLTLGESDKVTGTSGRNAATIELDANDMPHVADGSEAILATTASLNQAVNNVLTFAGQTFNAKQQWLDGFTGISSSDEEGQQHAFETSFAGTYNILENKNGIASTNMTLAEALRNIDSNMGKIHGLAASLGDKYKGNLAEGSSASDHFAKLDSSIGDRRNLTSSNATINAETAKSVAEGLAATSNIVGTMNFSNANIIKGKDNITDALTAIDEYVTVDPSLWNNINSLTVDGKSAGDDTKMAKTVGKAIQYLGLSVDGKRLTVDNANGTAQIFDDRNDANNKATFYTTDGANAKFLGKTDQLDGQYLKPASVTEGALASDVTAKLNKANTALQSADLGSEFVMAEGKVAVNSIAANKISGLATVATSGNFANLTVDDGAIKRAMIEDGAINRKKLAQGIKDSLDLADTAVQEEDLAAVAFSGKYADLKVADGAIKRAKLGEGVQASLDLADSSLQGIANNSEDYITVNGNNKLKVGKIKVSNIDADAFGDIIANGTKLVKSGTIYTYFQDYAKLGGAANFSSLTLGTAATGQTLPQATAISNGTAVAAQATDADATTLATNLTVRNTVDTAIGSAISGIDAANHEWTGNNTFTKEVTFKDDIDVTDGNVEVDKGDVIVSKGDVVVTDGTVQTGSLTLNGNKVTQVNTGVKSDGSADVVTGNGSGSVLATTATVMASAENAKFTADDNPAVSLNGATTINQAINNVASAVDKNTQGIADLNTLVGTLGTITADYAKTIDATTGNKSDPADIATAINNVATAAAKADGTLNFNQKFTTSDGKAVADDGSNKATNLTDAINNVAKNAEAAIAGAVSDIAKEIHGSGTEDDPAGEVKIGNKAATIVVGKSQTDTSGSEPETEIIAGIGIDTVGREVEIAAVNENSEVGADFDAKNEKVTVSAGNDETGNTTGMEIDNKGQSITMTSSDADHITTGMEISNKSGTRTVTLGTKTENASGEELSHYTLEVDGEKKTTTIGSGDGKEVVIGEGTVLADKSVMVGDPAGKVTAMYDTGIVAKENDNNQSTLGSTGLWVKKGSDEAGVSGTGMWASDGTKTANVSKTGLWVGEGTNSVSVGSTGVYVTDGTDHSHMGPAGIYTTKDVTAAGYVSGKEVVANEGLTLAGTRVTSIDTDGSKVSADVAQATRKATLATAETVYAGAENAKYTPAEGETGVTKNATTLHAAIAALDDAMGTMVLNTENKNFVKRDDSGEIVIDETTGKPVALDNATDALNALDAVVGNINDLDVSKGNLHASNKDVASHLSALDKRLGGIKDLGTNSTLAHTNLATTASTAEDGITASDHFNSLDVAIGDRQAYNNNADNFTSYVAVNDGTKDLTTMISEVASNIGKADDISSTNQISARQTVNANLSSLDAALGNVADLQQLGYSNVTQAIVGTDAKFTKAIHDLDMDHRKLRHDFEAGMAGQAALSALVPNAKASGNTQLAVGTGAYKGHTAAAVGGFHWFTDNLLFNAGVAWDNNEATGRMGITYSW